MEALLVAYLSALVTYFVGAVFCGVLADITIVDFEPRKWPMEDGVVFKKGVLVNSDFMGEEGAAGRGEEKRWSGCDRGTMRHGKWTAEAGRSKRVVGSGQLQKEHDDVWESCRFARRVVILFSGA